MHEQTEPMLQAQDVERLFGAGRTLLGRPKPAVHAVQGVSFAVRKGEILGIVGESGCGKSTLARILAGLDQASAGKVLFQGQDLAAAVRRDFKAVARQIQYVFQDPLSSLNPRKTVRAILKRPCAACWGWVGKSVKDAFKGDRCGRSATGASGSLSSRVLRQASPADRHRSSACRRTEADRP